MPIPTPTNDESKSEFIERCMSDSVMMDEFPDEDQRLAICSLQYEQDDDDSGRAAGRHLECRVTTTQGVVLRQDEDDGNSINGYAAVYYDGTRGTEYQLWEDVYERIAPGAFDDAIRNDDVRALFNHDPNHILGRTPNTLHLSSDDVGLAYEIEPANTTVAHDVMEHLRRGDVSGSSFQFIATSEEWALEEREGREVEVRTITGVKLYDVGPVIFPAYEGTTSGLRAAGDKSEARRSYRAWKAQQRQPEPEPEDENPDPFSTDVRDRLDLEIRLLELE